MADIIIESKDYKDLKTTYSEKNNINNVYGVEYQITDPSVTSFEILEDDYIDSNGEMIVEYYEHNDNYNMSTLPELPYPIKRIGKKNGTANLGIKDNLVQSGSESYWQDKNPYYLRQENAVIQGSFKARTKQTILDFESISASCSISYYSYVNQFSEKTLFPSQMFENNNYRSNKLLFETIRTNQYLQKDTDNNPLESIADNRIPSQNANFKMQIFGIEQRNLNMSDGLSTCYLSKPRVISVDENGTTIEIDYTITVWFASNSALFNYYLILFDVYHNRILNAVNKITFKVQANTIGTKQSDFSYGEKQENQYELETNELMQYEENAPYNIRQSYLSSQKILDGASKNRMIVSFDLLNCTPRQFEQNGTDINGVPTYETRQLKTGDLIKLKDPNNNFLGEYYDDSGNLIIPYFEIISYHGRWDGAFHAEIICKQKL